MGSATKTCGTACLILIAALIAARAAWGPRDDDAPATSISDQPAPQTEAHEPRSLTHQPTILRAESSPDAGTALSPLVPTEPPAVEVHVHDEPPVEPTTSKVSDQLPSPPLQEPLRRR